MYKHPKKLIYFKPSTGIGKVRVKRKTSSSREKASLGYKEFEEYPEEFDELGETFLYKGDGVETIQWFEEHTNFREIIKGATGDDKEALLLFIEGEFMYGQQYKGFLSMTTEEQNYTRSYDRLLDQSVVNANMKVVRLSTPELLFGKGRETTTLEELQSMKGRVITSKANLSTAAAKIGLGVGDYYKTIDYKIHIPAGAKGAGMYIGVSDSGIGKHFQREFMLNRDITLRVGNTRYNSQYKIFEVDLFFEGLLPHDYK